MKSIAFVLLLLVGAVSFQPAEAACSGSEDGNNGDRINRSSGDVTYTGSCEDDNEILVQSDSLLGYDACFVMSTAGAVDVFVTIDGTSYSTAALTLEDKGATDGSNVVVTVAGRVYAFPAKFRGVRVTQNGATDAAASLICWNYGA